MNQNQYIEEQLLLQYLLGKASADEILEVEAWLAQSETNRRELDRLEALWTESGKLAPPPVAVDADVAWNRVAARIEHLEEEQLEGDRRGRIFRLNVWRATAAAAAIIILAMTFWWFFGREEVLPLQQLASMDTTLTDTLTDGTMVILNTHSTLTFPAKFRGNVREVSLTGEAFFKVSSDKQKPFVVRASHGGIRVTGTEFDVTAFPGRPVTVLVTEGSVTMFGINPHTGDTLALDLEAGMKGILEPGSYQPYLAGDQASDELFWMDQTLEFRDVSLKEVFSVISRCYGIAIQMSDPSIGDCRLTTRFSGEPADVILKVIADTFGFSLEINQGIYTLTGSGCEPSNP